MLAFPTMPMLGGLGGLQELKAHDAWVSAPPGQAPPMTPGRASARTRARAVLRAKARARRREDGAALEQSSDAIPENSQSSRSSHHAEAANHCHGNVATHGSRARASSCSSSRSSGSSCSAIEEEEEEADEDIIRRRWGILKAWDYPLSASEKQERINLLFDKEVGQVYKEVRKQEGKVEQLKTEAGKLRDENGRLSDENAKLKRLVAELQEKARHQQPQQEQQQPPAAASLPPPLPQQRSQPVQVVPQQVGPWPQDVLPQQIPAWQQQELVQAQWQQQQEQAWVPQGDASFRLPPQLPMMPQRQVWDQHLSTPCATPRMQQMAQMTPRSATLAAPTGGVTARGSMRGTVNTITWGPGTAMATYGITWVGFESRVTGEWSIFGIQDSYTLGATEAECMLSLRRGEFISHVSGAFSQMHQPILAQWLRIVTSEGQEGVVGHQDCGYGYSDAAVVDFVFDANQGHEIVGLQVSGDGRICGIKQQRLPPPRASSSGAAGAAGASSNSSASALRQAGADTSSQSSFRPTLKGGKFSRIKEALEDYDNEEFPG